MAAERCPLCQSKLHNGECLSCGYRPPNEGDISALYNYDPTDYPQPEQAVREIMPDVTMEEIYPGRPEMPDIKVHDDQNNTVGRYGTGANQAAWQQAKQARQQQQANQAQQQNNPNPYADNGSFSPYQSPKNNNKPGLFQNPPQYNNIPTMNNSASADGFKDFVRDYWIYLLLSFLFAPIGGIIFFITFKDKVEAKYRFLFLAIMFLRIFFG